MNTIEIIQRARAIGVTIRLEHGEYRVALKGASAAESYYTDCRVDAAQTAAMIAPNASLQMVARFARAIARAL